MNEKEKYEKIEDIVINCMKKSSMYNGLNIAEISNTENEKLDPNEIDKILSNDAPYDSLLEELKNIYAEEILEMENEASLEIIEEAKETMEKEGITEVNDEDIKDIINEKIFVNLPVVDKYMEQPIKCAILINTGDSEYEFSTNKLLANDENELEYYIKHPENKEFNTASLFWLAETQGYSKEETAKFLMNRNSERNGKHSESPFLNSLAEELDNTTTNKNITTFLVKIPLKDLVTWKANKYTKTYEIPIPKDTECGLFDPENGAGGIMNICLEKDLIIPKNLVYNIENTLLITAALS